MYHGYIPLSKSHRRSRLGSIADVHRINALEMRTKGASLAMSTNWIMNYAVVQVTLPGIQNIGWKFWIIWAVICFSFIPITYFFYPETANR